jgi:hypothetical protein
METMRQSWTDERLDDLNARVSDGFRRIDERIDALRRTMLHGVIGLCGVFGAGFAALIVLIATQL